MRYMPACRYIGFLGYHLCDYCEILIDSKLQCIPVSHLQSKYIGSGLVKIKKTDNQNVVLV